MSPREAGKTDYESTPLAAMIDVFSLWTSGDFMRQLATSVDVDLDATGIVAVTLLGRNGGMRPSALAKRLGLGASAASKVIRRLGDAGLVERLAHPDDARAAHVTLTPRGIAVSRALVDAGDAMMRGLLTSWSEADREEFATLLARFRDEVTGRV